MSRACVKCEGRGSLFVPAGPFAPLTGLGKKCEVCDGSGLSLTHTELRKPENELMRVVYDDLSYLLKRIRGEVDVRRAG